jgi:hypothetical protein
MRLMEVLRGARGGAAGGGVAARRRLAAGAAAGRLGAVRHPERLERLTTEERIRDVVHVGDRVLLPHMRTDAVDRLVVAIGIAPEPLQVTAEGQRRRAGGGAGARAGLRATGHYLQMVASLARALRSEGGRRWSPPLRRGGARDPGAARPGRAAPALGARHHDAAGLPVYPDTPVSELLELLSGTSSSRCPWSTRSVRCSASSPTATCSATCSPHRSRGSRPAGRAGARQRPPRFPGARDHVPLRDVHLRGPAARRGGLRHGQQGRRPTPRRGTRGS